MAEPKQRTAEQQEERETKRLASETVGLLRKWILPPSSKEQTEITIDTSKRTYYAALAANTQNHGGFMAAFMELVGKDPAIGQEIKRRAGLAVDQLKKFIRSGDPAEQQAFLKLTIDFSILPGFSGPLPVTDEKGNVAFTLFPDSGNGLVEAINADRFVKPLLDILKRHLESKKPPEGLNLTKFLEAIMNAHLELGKPKNQQDQRVQDQMRKEYGAAFMDEMGRIISPPTITATPVPSKPGQKPSETGAPAAPVQAQAPAAPVEAKDPIKIAQDEAGQAFTLFKYFLFIGHKESYDQFSELFQKSRSTDAGKAFMAKFTELLYGDPTVKPIIDLLEEHYKARRLKFEGLNTVIFAANDFHDFERDKDKNKRTALIEKYGQKFVEKIGFESSSFSAGQAERAFQALLDYVSTGSKESLDSYNNITERCGISDSFLRNLTNKVQANSPLISELGAYLQAHLESRGENFEGIGSILEAVGEAYKGMMGSDYARSGKARLTQRWGAKFVDRMEEVLKSHGGTPRVAIDLIQLVSDSLIDDFMANMGRLKPAFPAPPDRQMRLGALEDFFMKSFDIVDRNVGDVVVKGILKGYFLIKEEDRPGYVRWVLGIDKAGKAALVSGIVAAMPRGTMAAPPQTQPENIAMGFFNEWKEKEGKREETIQELRGYLKRIRIGSLQNFLAIFERMPNAERLNDVIIRLEYVAKKKEILLKAIEKNKDDLDSKSELGKIDEELKALKVWLARMNISPTDVSDFAKDVEKQLTGFNSNIKAEKEKAESKLENALRPYGVSLDEFRAFMDKKKDKTKFSKDDMIIIISDKESLLDLQLQNIMNDLKQINFLYGYLSPDKIDVSRSDNLVGRLAELEGNPRAAAYFPIIKKYVRYLDANAANYFYGISPDATSFTSAIDKRLRERLDFTKVATGQDAWQKKFWPMIMGSTVPNKDQPNLSNYPELMQYMRLAELPPMAAAAFADYIEVVNSSHVTTQNQALLVARTMAKLNSVNSLLVVKYIRVITRAAEVCIDNPDAFETGLARIEAKVDAEISQYYNSTSPALIMGANAIAAVRQIDDAFNYLLGLDPAALAQYDRYTMLDRYINLPDRPSYEATQKPWPIRPNLNAGEQNPYGMFWPYFEPRYLYSSPPRPALFGGGMVGADYMRPGAQNISMPFLNLAQLPNQSRASLAAKKGYIDPTHFGVNVPFFLPGAFISPLSPTKFLKEIEIAFLPHRPAEYSGDVIGGGGGLGVMGSRATPDSTTQWGGGGLGGYMTPSGGGLVGGRTQASQVGGENTTNVYAGMMFSGVPLGYVNPRQGAQGTEHKNAAEASLKKGEFFRMSDELREFIADQLIIQRGKGEIEIPAETITSIKASKFGTIALNAEQREATSKIIEEYYKENKVEVNLRSAMGGLEMLDDDSRKALAKLIESNYSPQHSSNLLFAWNYQRTAKGSDGTTKSWQTWRYFAVTRQGTIYDVKAGVNELVSMFNYMSVFTDYGKHAPVITQANLQTALGTGGGVIVLDIGKVSELAHAQSVPFIAEGRTGEQPLLMQWTKGWAHTHMSEPGVTNTYEFIFPGKYLRLRPGGEIAPGPGGETQPGKPVEYTYFLQDTIFVSRKHGKKHASEFTIGMGVGTAQDNEEAKKIIGRGGALYRTRSDFDTFGIGASYEGGPTNMEQLAAVSGMGQQSESARQYVASLHRIGQTLYGSNKAAESRFIYGGLVQFMEQFKHEQGQIMGEPLLWRWIGFMKGLRENGLMDDTAVKIDVMRTMQLDEIITQYNSMIARVANDPSTLNAEINNFKNNINLSRVMDKYSAGLQVNANMSLEVKIVDVEDDNKSGLDRWATQKLDTVFMRFLYTWTTGFTRAFAAVPVYGGTPLSIQTGNLDVGVVGAGFGVDLWDSVWANRFAADIGIILARQQQQTAAGVPAEQQTWDPGELWPWKSGFTDKKFIQGLLRVYSDVLTDSKEYRKKAGKYKDYARAVQDNKYLDIPDDVRKIIAQKLREMKLRRQVVIDDKMIILVQNPPENGKVNLTPDQSMAVGTALGEWFNDSILDIKRRFNGHTRAYIGASVYRFGETSEVAQTAAGTTVTPSGPKTYWDISAAIEIADKFEKRVYAVVAKREEVAVFAGGEAQFTDWLTVGATMGASESGRGGFGVYSTIQLSKGPMPMKLTLLGYGSGNFPLFYTPPPYTQIDMGVRPAEWGGGAIFSIGGGMPNTGMLMGPGMGIMPLPGQPPSAIRP